MRRTPLLVGCLLVASLGCRKERWLPTTGQDSATLEGDDEPRGGGPGVLAPTVTEAMGVLASKRCERAVRCGSVGAGKGFADETQCRTAAKLSMESQRYLQRCATRIDRIALEACGEALAEVPCSVDPVELDDVGACRFRNLCRGEP